MKRLKRLFSVMLAMAMTLAMTMQVMAAGVAPTTDVTVTLPTDEILEGHTYTAYQIFTGIENPDKENALGDVKWGNGIDADAFMAALKASDKFGTTNPFANVTDALDVSAVLGTITPAQAITVAQIAYEHITETGTVLSAGTNQMVSGYYLIVDTTTDVGEDGVYNAALLQATSDVNIQVKTDKPEVTKKIVESGNKVDYNDTAIGNLVNYSISSNVPDVTQYKNYKFKVVDTLSKGLTYNPNSLKITIGGTDVPAENYTVTSTGGNGEDTTITILFNKCKTYFAGKAGQTLEITYNATLNEHAVIGVSGNDNKVKLEYSANPNEVGEGDEFNDDDVKGETPEDKVITYVTGIKITKVDGSNNEPLTGAQFQITGEKLEQGLVVGYEFVEAADGTYYRLKDGGYTTTAPTDSTTDKYADTETKYNKVDKTGLTTLKKETVDFVAEVGENGILSVAGLSAGTYVIKEIKAPDGYNILKDDITLVITCNTADLNASSDPLTQNDCTWTLVKTVNGTSQTLTSKDNFDAGLFAFDIQNNQGAELPETGGIGTTIFYIVGGILVVGAAILLVTKKRMSKEA